MSKSIKVLVADDSVLMRLLITDLISSDPEIEVIGTANNGKDAAEKARKLNPDVLVMDMNMGEYDGIYAVKRIMEECPLPIVILSAVGNSDMTTILEALALGALDYVNKPAEHNSRIADVNTQLVEKIKIASQSKIKRQPAEQKQENITIAHTFLEDTFYDIVVIGASTGGPPAIEKIVYNLPENFAVPIIIVQHMPPNFVPSFVSRINQNCPLEVVIGQKGEVVERGKVIIAPGSRNMILKQNEEGKVVIDFTTETFREYNYPSVNSVMKSVAEIYGPRAIGVILTGMGKDGAMGMKLIRDQKGLTIAQSKETCVVYGMPREAVEIGAVMHTVPINEISFFLVSSLS